MFVCLRSLNGGYGGDFAGKELELYSTGSDQVVLCLAISGLVWVSGGRRTLELIHLREKTSHNLRISGQNARDLS